MHLSADRTRKLLTNIVKFLDLLQFSDHPPPVARLTAERVTTHPHNLGKKEREREREWNENTSISTVKINGACIYVHVYNTFGYSQLNLVGL